MQPDRNNALALVRAPGKRCPDCGERRPASAFYVRLNGQLSAYCKPHQRARAKASYNRRRQDPATLARMRELDRIRKRASRARRKTLGSDPETSLGGSRATATRRLIAAHPDEYHTLLAAEGTKGGRSHEPAAGGDSDAA
jgi:hypothetical protein